MKKLLRFTLCVAFVIFNMTCLAQHSTPIISPEVHADNSVTFRLRAPNALKVMVAREGSESIAMQKNDDGIWSVTTAPLEPDIYGYNFIADDVNLLDPSNHAMKTNLLYTDNLLHVPGTGLPWELTDVPHGIVHHHHYKSSVVGDNRDFYVYTPPRYDPRGKKAYPVLYLLHGFSDDASGWTTVGRAELILDNLIAEGKAIPMIVVMPLGYGAPEIVDRNGPGLGDHKLRDRNYAKFREALLSEVVPEVERTYRIVGDRNSRAIAGLSMGGSEALLTGLNALDKFAWIGAFSSGGLDENFDALFPALSSNANKQLRLLWISCGKEDHLIDVNRRLTSWLDSKGIQHTKVETAGSHTWMVWRRNLASLVQLLFQKPNR